MAFFDPNCLVAQALDLVVAVGNNEDSNLMLFDKLLDALLALLLEHEVANR